MLSKLRVRNKKGQAAMEFLMTYGWAILIAIIAIAALIAFGVLNVGKTSANVCTLTTPLDCKGASVNTSAMRVEIYNGAGDTINITSIAVNGTGTFTGRNCGSAPSTNLVDGNQTVYDLTCSGTAPTVNQKFKGDFTVTYTVAGSTLARVSSGTVAQSVA